jgi:F-type H+-transporting ATPase subunit b
MATPTVETTGATAPAGAAPATFPPFDTSSFASQLLWFALAFGLLYFLMSKLVLPRIAALLEDRSHRIAADLAQAQTMRDESEAAAAAHEKALAEASGKAKAIAQETRDKLAAEAETRRKTLEAELAQKLAGAEATIRERTGEAMGHVRGIAAETAATIVERLTGQAPERHAVEAALDRVKA